MRLIILITELWNVSVRTETQIYNAYCWPMILWPGNNHWNFPSKYKEDIFLINLNVVRSVYWIVAVNSFNVIIPKSPNEVSYNDMLQISTLWSALQFCTSGTQGSHVQLVENGSHWFLMQEDSLEQENVMTSNGGLKLI